MHERSEPPERAAATGTSGGREAVQRWRLTLRRAALEGDTGGRDQLASWEAALAASGLPVAGLDTPRQKPRFAIAAPLAAAIPGEAELVDVWLVERLPQWRVREALACGIPDAWTLVDLHDVWLGEAALPGRVTASVYLVELAADVDAARLRDAAEVMLAAGELPRERRKGDATVRYDLRPFVVALEVTPGKAAGPTLRMTLRHDPERGVGRPDEVLAALGERVAPVPLTPLEVVREGLVLADPPVPEPPAPRVPRRGGPGGRPGGHGRSAGSPQHRR